MVAALLGWHEHHAQAAHEIEARLDQGEQFVVAAPALVETYAVLTRLPPPHRLSPGDAWRLLQANFLHDTVQVATLNAQEYRDLLAGAPLRGVAGGATYDAVIVACALAAEVDALLTFNERQFRLLAGDAIQIVVPGS